MAARPGVHLPSPSFWPLVLAIGLPIIGYGIIFNLWALCDRWASHRRRNLRLVFEPVDDPNAGHGHDDHHEDEAGDDQLAGVGSGSASDDEGEG